MFRLLLLMVALDLTWLVWSGLYKPLLLALGLVSVFLVLWLALRMDLTQKTVFTLDLIPRALGFWVWVAWEVVKANFQVARIILTPRLPISPTLVTLEPPLPGLIGQATLANSITLTPGTVTVDAHEGTFKVHCLTVEGADDMHEGEMGRRVARAFGDR